jgi:hypothetical protein
VGGWAHPPFRGGFADPDLRRVCRWTPTTVIMGADGVMRTPEELDNEVVDVQYSRAFTTGVREDD